jgi:predicted FMN-binding regulatory protein PaiB
METGNFNSFFMPPTPHKEQKTKRYPITLHFKRINRTLKLSQNKKKEKDIGVYSYLTL